MDDLTRYICESVKQRLKQRVYVSWPAKCNACGARVRLIGESKANSSWMCPLCGAELPYVFWKVGCESVSRIPLLTDLILGLAPDACEKCGESPAAGDNSEPGCRCQRQNQARLTALACAYERNELPCFGCGHMAADSKFPGVPSGEFACLNCIRNETTHVALELKKPLQGEQGDHFKSL